MNTNVKSKRQIEQLKEIARPATPGDVLADFLENLELTQGQLATALGVGRKTINELVLGKRPVSQDMAMRLGRCFGNGPAFWLKLQHQVDLWDVLHSQSGDYDAIRPIDQAA